MMHIKLQNKNNVNKNFQKNMEFTLKNKRLLLGTP